MGKGQKEEAPRRARLSVSEEHEQMAKPPGETAVEGASSPLGAPRPSWAPLLACCCPAGPLASGHPDREAGWAASALHPAEPQLPLPPPAEGQSPGPFFPSPGSALKGDAKRKATQHNSPTRPRPATEEL